MHFKISIIIDISGGVVNLIDTLYLLQRDLDLNLREFWGAPLFEEGLMYMQHIFQFWKVNGMDSNNSFRDGWIRITLMKMENKKQDSDPNKFEKN